MTCLTSSLGGGRPEQQAVLPTARRRAKEACLTVLFAAMLLNGCASHEPRYYTLSSDLSAIPFPSPSSGQLPLWVKVAPVYVPERLNRAQLVAQDGRNTGALKLMEFERWSAPLPDELQSALSEQLQFRLGAIDSYRLGQPAEGPVYLITTEVIRLDTELGLWADASINWTVRRQPDGKLASGRTQARLPVEGSVNGMVVSYREIVSITANDIAAGIRGMMSH